MADRLDNASDSRRLFMKRLIKAGLSAAAACMTGAVFYDPRGPKGEERMASTVQLADFSIKAIMCR